MKHILIHLATNPDVCYRGMKAVSPKGLKTAGLLLLSINLSIPRINLENKPRCSLLGYTNVLIIFLCLQLAGCAFVLKNKRLEREAAELQESLRRKDAEISKLQASIGQLRNSLKEKEGEIQEKDLKIEQLRKKLEGLGVFQ